MDFTSSMVFPDASRPLMLVFGKNASLYCWAMYAYAPPPPARTAAAMQAAAIPAFFPAGFLCDTAPVFFSVSGIAASFLFPLLSDGAAAGFIPDVFPGSSPLRPAFPRLTPRRAASLPSAAALSADGDGRRSVPSCRSVILFSSAMFYSPLTGRLWPVIRLLYRTLITKSTSILREKGALSCYCSRTSQSEVFFVSAAQQKSQTAGPLGSNPGAAAPNRISAVCVHREACYRAQPGRV